MINITHQGGLRTGSYDIAGVRGDLPIQAITSTNLHHASLFSPNQPFDFGTNILEIIEPEPYDLFDPVYYDSRKQEVSKMIMATRGLLHTFVPAKIKSKFSDKLNRILVQFQLDCGFSIIKVFFKSTNFAKYQKYRSSFPKDKIFVAVIDENMESGAFEKFYLDCLTNGDEIIGFFGRDPNKKSKSSTIQLHKSTNFTFLRQRADDKIIRLSSFIPKSPNQNVGSLVYYLAGSDVFSFMTKFGPPPKKWYPINVFDDFTYKKLDSSTNFRCEITGKNLYKSALDFKQQHKNSSIPVYTYNIVQTNKEFKKIHTKYDRKKLEQLIH